MSVFFEEGRGWKYDFKFRKRRFQSNYYRTKREAKEAEADKLKELNNPIPEPVEPTDTAFLTLLNRRLDHLQAYNSESHYRETKYLAKRWARQWKDKTCNEISRDDIEKFVLKRRKVSNDTANKEIRYLRALFNFGIKKGWLCDNSTIGIEFLPVEKKVKYVPPLEDINKVIDAADAETKEYLWTIWDTMGRMSEVNSLTWDDVDFAAKTVTLYTRKKKGGHLTPRKVPMTLRLYNILHRRFRQRKKGILWVFWHEYTSSKTRQKVIGPYHERKRFMKTLCKKAGVRYFRFHALRHAGASLMENSNVPIGAIQRILGHENRTTTEIYLHSIGCSEREAINIFEQVSGNSLSKSLSDEKRATAK